MDPKLSFKNIFKEIFQTAVISLLIFLAVYTLLVQPHRVKGESMVPNFSDGELILTEKISYRFSDAKKGDVIVFKAPSPRNVDFIKRIIGLPGETISFEGGKVQINGRTLSEPYINMPTHATGAYTLAEDEYFVLGDNRGSSSDSRSFGTVKKQSFRGRAWLVYWPLFKSENTQGFRIISRVNNSVSDSLNNL